MKVKIENKTITLEVKQYIAEDGTVFDSEFQCELYEQHLKYKEVPDGIRLFTIKLDTDSNGDKYCKVTEHKESEFNSNHIGNCISIITYSGDDFELANRWCHYRIEWTGIYILSNANRTLINAEDLDNIWDDIVDGESYVYYPSEIDKFISYYNAIIKAITKCDE